MFNVVFHTCVKYVLVLYDTFGAVKNGRNDIDPVAASERFDHFVFVVIVGLADVDAESFPSLPSLRIQTVKVRTRKDQIGRGFQFKHVFSDSGTQLAITSRDDIFHGFSPSFESILYNSD